MSRKPFGEFILAKKGASGALGELAQAAAGDRGFPTGGDPQAISKRLNEQMAPAEFHEALEEAEAEWRALA